ncbi:AsmA family protein [Methylomonas paludis]|uniref:AsmA family protein n=1 Tax=Methylomonas paludis TaxID=1173101 RepID=A0A975RA84_9GAMM|nr:AsmA family protein [Methylomonas paludis]QWF71882.1 AsmA family protein [Methylomonas paludis]
MLSIYSGSTRVSKVLRRLSLALAFLFVIGFVGIILMPNSWVRGVAANKGSALLDREFAVDGDIDIDWDWTQPKVSLHKLRIANLSESKDKNMLVIETLSFEIKIWKLLLAELNLPSLSLVKPKLILEKFTPTKNNWDFPLMSKANLAGKAALPNERNSFPIIGSLLISDGQLTYRDVPKQLATQLTIVLAKGGEGQEQAVYRVTGQGTLQNKPFSIQAKGGSLSMLRNNSQPYPLQLNINMGSTRVSLEGTFADPVQMTGVNAQLDLRGDNLADLFYLTGIPLPPTPPYKLNGHLQKQDGIWAFHHFQGQVGDSDLSGELTYDTSKPQGLVKAELVSKLLDMKDLAGFIGVTPTTGILSPAQIAQAEREKSSPHLLPDIPINLIRLRAADMTVRLKANQIKAPDLPINDLDIGFNIEHGVLKMNPFNFGVAYGSISGSLILDGQTDIASIESDLLIKRLSFKQFFAKTQFESLSSGYFGGRLQLKGSGKSLAEVLAISNGRIILLMSGGSISLLIVDAAGLNLGQAIPLLLGKDQSTDIRCAIADFQVKNGLLNSDVFVLDTTDSNIAGAMHINLKDEVLAAKVEAHPKDFSLLSARTPIIVSGTLKKPAIGLDPEALALRSSSAVALGVLLSPVAAIIPFIELGLGKDSDCRELIQHALAYSEAKPVPKLKKKSRVHQ